MDRRSIRIGAAPATALLLVVAATVLLKNPMPWPVHGRAIEVVQGIESFRRQRGRLPRQLAELRMSEPADTLGIFYQRFGDTSYVVWHGTSLGESLIFESSTESWRR